MMSVHDTNLYTYNKNTINKLELKALEYHNERKVIDQYKNFDDASSNPNYCFAKRELYAKYRDRMENDGGEVGWIVAKYNKGYIS